MEATRGCCKRKRFGILSPHVISFLNCNNGNKEGEEEKESSHNKNKNSDNKENKWNNSNTIKYKWSLVAEMKTKVCTLVKL